MKDPETAKFARKEISCPVAVRDYSKFMGGVDLADQLYSYYCFGKNIQKVDQENFLLPFKAYGFKLAHLVQFDPCQENLYL